MNFKLMRTTIIHGSKLWVGIVIWTLLLISLLIVNYFYFNQNKFLILFSIICLIAPWIFFDKILKTKYSEKIEIKLDYDLWLFIISKDGIEEKYKLSDVESYSITESSNGFSSGLAFKLKISNPKKISFIIYNKKQNEDETDTEEILESFHSMIKNYNKTFNIGKQILLIRTFEESVSGLVAIYILGGLIIVAVTLHIIYNKIGTLPLSLLFGGGILLRLIAVRQRDLKRRKNITK